LLKQIGALIYVCISFVFIKEDRPTLQKIVGALVGFVGIIALNFSGNGFSLAIGDVFILGASFCTVVSSVISKNVVSRVAPINVTGIS
jgi:drug/metabolite transporter (DMT)-like permease